MVGTTDEIGPDKDRDAHVAEPLTSFVEHRGNEYDRDTESSETYVAEHCDPTYIPLPDDISQIQRMTQILKQHPGDQNVTIGTATHQVSDE
ncbi:MAG: hypothetical protein H6766_02335 [Candidatus Peribacteria bacterium]|nr:MAG: hypothetical protein H6766_02335 [Candidatus Peribacteria bacterium]